MFSNSMRTLGLLLAILAGATSALGVDSLASRHAAQQWQMTSLSFQVDEVPDNPIDVSFTASLRLGETRIDVPGFWNGGSEYLVRFTPPHPGRWKFETRSEFRSLDGREGIVDVSKADKNDCGSVTITPERPLRFTYQNGKPYFPIAMECDWLFALDAENASDIPRTRQFIDSVAANGFNQIVMNVYAYDVNWKKDPSLRQEHEFGSPSVFPFGGTNDAPQHTQLNMDYFQRLDRVVEYLNQRDIVAHIMIYVWNKRVNWPEAGSTEDNRYFDYVVKRYQAYPNVLWDISKEALGYGHDDVHFITDRIERLRRIDAHQRLVTVHDYGYCRRFPDELDFVSVQLWQSELYSVMRKVVETFPKKPVLNIEHGGYERGPYRVFVGEYTSPETCLERAYQCIFAGTYPTHYWQGSAWNVIVADIQSLPEAERPKLHYYKHLANLIHRYDFDRLSAGKKFSNSGFCLTDESRLFVYYVPKENDFINLRLPANLRGKTMKGTWFNPFTGDFSEPVEKTVVQWPAFDAPTTPGFSVLIIEVEQ